MLQIDDTLQPDNLQENAAVQQAGPRAGEGKEDDFVMLPWQKRLTGCPSPRNCHPCSENW